jgi:hypothetical protein
LEKEYCWDAVPAVHQRATWRDLLPQASTLLAQGVSHSILFAATTKCTVYFIHFREFLMRALMLASSVLPQAC